MQTAHRKRRRKRKAPTLKKVRRLPYDYKARLAYLAFRDGGICGLCGHPVDSRLRWPDPASPTIDHIQAKAKGGARYERYNQQLAHLRCNQEKGVKTMRRVRANQLQLNAWRKRRGRTPVRQISQPVPPYLAELLRTH